MNTGRKSIQPNNQNKIRSVNQMMIIDTLRQNPASRAELARRSGLTKAAITGLADSLIRSGLIRETEPAVTTTGRRPVLLAVNPDYARVVVLNLSRVAYNLGLADFAGNIIRKKELPIQKPDDLLAALPDLITELLCSSSNPDRIVLGMGITAPGPLDREKGRFLNPPDFISWHGIHIVERLQGKLKYPVFLENNASAAAIAEFYQGRAHEYDNFLVLTVDSGIGAGLFLNRQPYQGDRGFGQEAGHMTIDWQGKPCACGNKGCLERYASIPELLAQGRNRYGCNSPSSWRELVDRALGQDPAALNLLEQESDYLAAALVNIRNFLELDAVILAGELIYKPEMILYLLRKKTSNMALSRNSRQMVIEVSALSPSEGLIPAAAAVLRYAAPAI